MDYKKDEISEGFKFFTEKGRREDVTKKMVDYLMDLVLSDLAFRYTAIDGVLPFLTSFPRGLPPN